MMVSSTVVSKDNIAASLDRALDAGGGLLRLTPTWVPRSFLHPGKRIKLAPTDWYTLDMHPNKHGHQEIATQILEQLARTDYGRHCLSG